MSQTITLTLVKPLIKESVKNETFQRGNIDRSIDAVKNGAVAYHEQAGDEAYHERILDRALYTAVEELKTQLSEYLSTTGFSAADNSIDSEESGDNIVIHLVVSDRFNKGYTNSLAKLCHKYVEESMLMDWWKPVNEKQSALYAQFVERQLQNIRRCFNKTAPSIPAVPYTEKLQVTASAIELETGEEATVTYELSDGAIDDIEVEIEDTTLIRAGRSEQGFTVTGLRRGHTWIKLYSRHNDELNRIVHVYITDHS